MRDAALTDTRVAAFLVAINTHYEHPLLQCQAMIRVAESKAAGHQAPLMASRIKHEDLPSLFHEPRTSDGMGFLLANLFYNAEDQLDKLIKRCRSPHIHTVVYPAGDMRPWQNDWEPKLLLNTDVKVIEVLKSAGVVDFRVPEDEPVEPPLFEEVVLPRRPSAVAEEDLTEFLVVKEYPARFDRYAPKRVPIAGERTFKLPVRVPTSREIPYKEPPLPPLPTTTPMAVYFKKTLPQPPPPRRISQPPAAEERPPQVALPPTERSHSESPATDTMSADTSGTNPPSSSSNTDSSSTTESTGTSSETTSASSDSPLLKRRCMRRTRKHGPRVAERILSSDEEHPLPVVSRHYPGDLEVDDDVESA